MQKQLDADKFKKSSLCGCGCGCVGVAITPDVIAVTNTTTPGGPQAFFSHDEWRLFIAGVKAGEFDVA